MDTKQYTCQCLTSEQTNAFLILYWMFVKFYSDILLSKTCATSWHWCTMGTSANIQEWTDKLEYRWSRDVDALSLCQVTRLLYLVISFDWYRDSVTPGHFTKSYILVC